jgi:hypothetical protein
MNKKRSFTDLLWPVLVGVFIVGSVMPIVARGQSLTGDSVYNGAKYNYVVNIPPNWNSYDTEFTALKGGTVHRLLLTQYTDLVSRPIKYFTMQVGSPSSVFGVNKKVVENVTKEQLVDFYIDQLNNSSIDLIVTKTYTKDDGGNKVYTMEGSYAVPGYRSMIKIYFEFKNDRVYIWQYSYLDAFPNFAPTLQQTADSVKIS